MVKRLQLMATDCFDRLIIEEEEKYEAKKSRILRVKRELL